MGEGGSAFGLREGTVGLLCYEESPAESAPPEQSPAEESALPAHPQLGLPACSELYGEVTWC